VHDNNLTKFHGFINSYAKTQQQQQQQTPTIVRDQVELFDQ